MSEQAPESEAPARSSGGPFTRKLGPLPLWAWMGIALAVALGYYFWKQNKANAAVAQSAQTGQATTDSSLVPQFVNQTFVSGAPPSAPDTTPAGGGGGTGGGGGDTGGGGGGTNPGNWYQGWTAITGGTTGVSQYPAPTGLTAKKLTNTSAQLHWNFLTSPTPTPQSYTVAVYQLNGKLAERFTVNAPSNPSGGQAVANVSGLHPGWSYNVNVWANGGKTAPQHSTVKVTV